MDPAYNMILRVDGEVGNEPVTLVVFGVKDGPLEYWGHTTVQSDLFVIDCLRECRRRGLHTAVDTCGLAPRETLLEVAELTDLVLFDLKHMDPDRHREETGVGNRIILENLRALSEGDAEVWIRVPLVPGFNDDPGNIAATGAFLGDLPRRHRVCVLPYHGIARGKRSRLGEDELRSEFRAPEPGSLNAVVQRLADHDLEVAVGGSP